MAQEKQKIYKYCNITPQGGYWIWVVAYNETEAKRKMASADYTVGDNPNKGDFWLEGVADKAFNELIIV